MRIATSLFLGLLLLSVISAPAQFTYTTNNGSLTITGPVFFHGTMNIPSMIGSLPVTCIASRAFANSVVNEVIIPASVTNIGSGAFEGCFELTSITVADQNAYYSSLNGALFNASETALIQYPGGLGGSYIIPDGVTNIGSGAFEEGALGTISIPASVTSIDSLAFVNCTYLREITVDPGNPAYSSTNGVLFDLDQDTLIAFPGSAKGNYAIPDSVTSIDPEALADCNLGTITIPGSVTNIGTEAFSGNASLGSITVNGTNAFYTSSGGVLFDLNQDTLIQYPPAKSGSTYAIPNTVTNIADAAFNYSTLKNITIPSGVTVFGNFEFERCTNLTNIAILGNIPRIGTNAFLFCTNLAGITIPASVTNIADDAFEDCFELGTIAIPGSVKSIGQFAFFDCDGLTNAAFTNGVASIGTYAFDSCTSLTNLTLPGSVTNLGSYAFGYCSNLAIAYFLGNAPAADATVFTGETNAPVYYFAGGTGWGSTFGGCQAALFPFAFTTNAGAISITGYSGTSGSPSFPAIITGLPATSIGPNAFASNNVLQSLTIPASITNIGNEAFAACSKLFAITVSPKNAFYSSTNGVLFDKVQATLIQFPSDLSDGFYIVPASVTSIGTGAFMQGDLQTILLPNDLVNISAAAFANCDEISSIAIPNSVTNIGDDAFFGCVNLTGIIIPDNVTSLGNGIFENCRYLRSITFGDSIASIGTNAFYGCQGLTVLNLPAGVTNIGSEAFGDSGLVGVYFAGNAPAVGSLFSVSGIPVYYFPGTSGWSSTLGGAPAELWNPQIQTGDGSFGVRTNRFGFNVTASNSLTVVLETCTNLANPVWQPLQTNRLFYGTSYFSDAQWTNFPSRFYLLGPP